MRGFVRVPREEESSRELYERYDRFLKQRADTVRTLVEERTADLELQEKVYDSVMQRIQRLY
jgi:aminopeptidase C